MNATWGLFPPLAEELRRTDKRERARAQLARARASFAAFVGSRPDLVAERYSPPPADREAEPAAIAP